MKLWGGRFNKPTAELMEAFNASIEFDACLAEVDIQGSLAHVEALGRCGVLIAEEVQHIQTGLQEVLQDSQAGKTEFTLADEDIHMNIERLLHQKIGDVAGKLHTGRSRNDQVATDMHLYMREQVTALMQKIKALQKALIQQAEEHINTLVPGYTHLQRAQPIRFAHHLLAYFWMLQRDYDRFADNLKRIDLCPLGAGALAGSGFPVDREFVATKLGFSQCYENSLDAVSDRDYLIEFLSVSATTMMHLSRLSEELILWSSREFNFIELDDAYCTGSSMMPQKKNPDIPELVRGKTGRVYGALLSLLTVQKGLPLAYNKDMQEDKEGVFDALGTLHACLDLFAPLIETMVVNVDTMRSAVTQDFSNATELADYLVKQGVPFRKSHAITGQLVMHCVQANCYLADLPLSEMQSFSDSIQADVFDVLQPEHAVEARAVKGGVASASVLAQLALAQENLV